MDAAEKKQLEITACKVRMGIIEGVHSAKSGSYRHLTLPTNREGERWVVAGTD